MAASSAPLSPLALSSIFKPKPLYLFPAQNSSSSIQDPILAFAATQPSIRRSYKSNLLDAIRPKTTKSWKLSAINGNFLLSEASPVESSQEIVSTSDGDVSTIISALLFVAFIGLSILTIGVRFIPAIFL